MNRKLIWILLFVCILSGGAFFRVWRLQDRPMHTDEAVHAEKFKALLQEGFYAYDPDEFHGPTLNYFTLISAGLRGEKTYTEINEVTLRLIPAVFGIALILTPLFFLKGMSHRAVFFSCFLLAFSPAFVYYSRYYIQEMLLVFFTAGFLGCGWRYIDSRKLIWAVLSGVSIGLMHASKETFIFSIVAAAVALAFCIFYDKPCRIKYSHLLAAIAAMVITSILFFSSFGTNPSGILDSVATYGIWAQRAGAPSVHAHPWYYYLDILTWLEFIEPVTWNEDGIVVLAVLGLLFAFTRRTMFSEKPVLIQFLAAYTIILTVIYCLIPYKTPWCLLSFLFGMTLLAGFVIDWLIGITQTILEKICINSLIVVFVVASPIVQSWFLNFQYAADPTNPYVYAHTSDDIYKMVDTVEKAVQVTAEGKETLVHIIGADRDYWPLPWYLRNYSKVGYWSEIDPSICGSPLILANAEHEQELLEMLYSVPEAGHKHLYILLFEDSLELRPGVEWRGYIRKDLWDRSQHSPESVDPAMKPKEKILESVPDREMIQDLVKFSHRAMNANFEIFIQHEDGTYAGRAARAAFNEVDRLEALLSRYIDNSDVSRINLLSPFESVIVDEHTIKCLQVAQQAYKLTDGAFNVTIGNLIAARKRADNEQVSRLMSELTTPEMIRLDDAGHSVKVLRKGVNIDLGGIGKGYAVDVAADVLTKWGIKKALIHGGASSVLALG
ncbi:MAG: flippase activity-associated protein Agl23, partial [Planctomycetota bacterium]